MTSRPVPPTRPRTASLGVSRVIVGLTRRAKRLLKYGPASLWGTSSTGKGAPVPPARSRGEVQAVMARTGRVLVTAPHPVKPIVVVLCAGPKDHGPGEHDYPLWQKRWAKLLSKAQHVTVEAAHRWPSSAQMSNADVIVFYSNNPDWNAAHAAEAAAFVERGGGLGFLHYALAGHENTDELANLVGLAWRSGQSTFRHGAVDVTFQPHPITEGFDATRFVDESYADLTGSETRVHVLASGVEGGRAQPLLWVREQGKGRVFASVLGHYAVTFDDPLFRLLLLRGIAWTAHEPVNRFSDLSMLGARLTN